MRQNSKKPALKYTQGQLVLVKQHRASKWAPKWDGPFEIKTVISENTFRIRKLNSTQEDIVHVDYIRPYYSRDGSPAVGNEASFPEESDERSDNINYETEYLYNEPSEDIVIEVDTSATSPPSNKVAGAAKPVLSPRVTRSKTRQLNQQTSSDLSKPDAHAPASTNPSTKHKSVLSQARASLKKVLPKRVLFSRKNVPSGSRQHFRDELDASTSAQKPSVLDPTSTPALANPFDSSDTTSASNFEQKPSSSLNVEVDSNSDKSQPALTIDIVSVPSRSVVNKKTTNSRRYNNNQ
jgi:hypothetical protein